MSFDIQGRRYNESFDSSKLPNVLRSPDGGLNNSILRNKGYLYLSVFLLIFSSIILYYISFLTFSQVIQQFQLQEEDQ